MQRHCHRPDAHTNGSSVAGSTYKHNNANNRPRHYSGGNHATVPSNEWPANYLAADKFTNTGTTRRKRFHTLCTGECRRVLRSNKNHYIIINPEPVTANGWMLSFAAMWLSI